MAATPRCLLQPKDRAFCKHLAGVQHLNRQDAIRRIEVQDDARMYLLPFNCWARDEADRQRVSLGIVCHVGSHRLAPRIKEGRYNHDISARWAEHNP